MKFSDFVKYCKLIESSSSRKQKVVYLVQMLKNTKPEEVGPLVRLLLGRPFPPGSDYKLEIGPSTVYRVLRTLKGRQALLLNTEPTVLDVYRLLEKIARVEGEGSRRKKEALFRSLLSQLSQDGREYLLRSIFGEMRIGASEGVILEAIAQLANCPVDVVRRAYMFVGDLGRLAEIALRESKEGVESVRLEVFRPVKPMMAEMAYDLGRVLREHGGRTALEYKYDGIRVQIHGKGGKIRVFTRRLSEITQSVPDIVRVVADTVRADSFVLDGEAVGMVDGKPVPFQDIAKRVRRQRDLHKFLAKIPLKLYLFDILYLNSRVLVDEPYEKRWETLADIVPSELLAERRIVDNLKDAEDFYRKAIAEGHEGVMAKRLDSNYEPGHRGKKWFKIKQADTIDCVIIAAEWGHGRREGWLSDYHLAVLDEETGRFVMVGKTFKGLTDEEFEEMTKRLLELKVREEGYVVYVVPKIVVEVAYSEIQKSPRYESGFALRFARITRIRWDKDPYEVTTLKELRERYEKQFEAKARVT